MPTARGGSTFVKRRCSSAFHKEHQHVRMKQGAKYFTPCWHTKKDAAVILRRRPLKQNINYSTVTDFAKLRGLSMSQSLKQAV